MHSLRKDLHLQPSIVSVAFMFATAALLLASALRLSPQRLPGWAGIGLVAALVASFVVMPTLDYLPTRERALAFFSDLPERVRHAGVIGSYGAIFLMWFAGGLYRLLRDAGGADMAAVSLAGAGIVGLAILVSGGILWFAASRAIGIDGLTAETARLFHDLNTVLTANVMTFGLVVLIGAAGVGSLSTGVFPAWLGWASMVIAVGLLTPIHYIFEGIGFIWIAAVSLVMLRGPA